MAKSALTRQQRNSYGRYNGAPTHEQLTQFFFLDDFDLSLITEKRAQHNKLGFALQICTLRFLGVTFDTISDVPLRAVNFVAKQLKIRELTCRYKYSEQTRKQHLTEIKDHYSYRDFRSPYAMFRFLRWLYARLWTGDESFHALFDLSTRYLVTNKILLPGVSTLERQVNKTKNRSMKRLVSSIYRQIPNKNRRKLDQLLSGSESGNTSPFNEIKEPIPKVNTVSINAMLDRLDIIRSFEVQHLDLSRIPKSKLQVITKRVHKSHVSNIRRLDKQKRLVYLAIYVHMQEIKTIDQSMDLVEAYISELQRQAKNNAQKDRLRTIKELDEAARLLSVACSIVINPEVKDKHVRETVYSKASQVRIEKAISTVNLLTRSKDDQNQKEWLDNFNRIKRFLPRLLNSVHLKATVEESSVLSGLEYLLPFLTGENSDTFIPPMEHVPKSWRRNIVNDNEFDIPAYTVCTTKLLREKLIRRDIFVTNSESWNDPRLRLLRGKDWLKVKAPICRSLNLSEQPEPKLNELKTHLNRSYQEFIDGLPGNEDVRIEKVNDKPKLIISHLDKLDEPESLSDLRQRVKKLMPPVDLPELLLEMHSKTGFAHEFFHVTENKSRASDIHISIAAVALAEACNIGLEPIIQDSQPALTRGRLKWVQQNYFRPETINAANRNILRFHSEIPLIKKWGEGHVASADGLRFMAPVHTAYTKHNKKYFQDYPGITYYNFMTDQFAGFQYMLIPGTMRDSLYLLQGILDQESHVDPREIMVDTAGVSNVVFGLFWLLGFQFSPRIADMGSMSFWRADREMDYGDFAPFCNHNLKLELAENNWEDILRAVGSLKLGKIGATEFVRSLMHHKRPSTLARSIAEIGKAAKTIHALRTLTDKNYRRRILTQLNRTESRHTLARAICYGNSGELKQKYTEGQEDQLGALGLVTNIVVTWNTLYLEAIINHLKEEGYVVRDEDIARITPLLD